jgi:2-polyprenyl-6-methoxyphenol hydroxylase-like FAD-dependent oxidoreductase
MESIPVAIVGAGPAGLVLGLSLAQNGIKVSTRALFPIVFG